jgi:hypothetical protein
MSIGMLQRLILIFQDVSRCFAETCLGSDMEAMAILVHRIMSYQSRQFHTLEHVFGFLDEADEVTSIAAVFHDLIYYQVDEGFPLEVKDLVGSVVVVNGARINLRDLDDEDRPFQLCRHLFGFETGQALLPFAGLNEFLSAIVMLRLLAEHVTEKDLVAAVVCIEASIPFRGNNGQGRSMAEELEFRLSGLEKEFGLGFSPDELRSMVDRAVAFANHDVKDFALVDVTRFLNNTWKLLPELNSSLRQSGVFTIREYRVALVKMRSFFRGLDLHFVFHDFRGKPDTARMKDLAEKVQRNLAIASSYISAKLLAMGLLESICLETGRDAPVALFMGDVPHGDGQPEKLDDWLPPPPTFPLAKCDDAVDGLLEAGRLDDSSFDLKNSPLALFIHRSLSPEERIRMDGLADSFFRGKSSPQEFLLSWEPRLRTSVMRACARMAVTRKDAIEAWLAANP